MKNDLISVIIPCYNVSKFLEDLFESLRNQTYKNFEIIFINDGSKDNTLAKLNSFCQSQKNSICIDQPNQGVSIARNVGLANANGKYIYFCDPDDMFSPNILEILHKNIAENNADCSVCKSVYCKENAHYNIVKKRKKKKIEIFEGTENIFTQYLSGGKFDICLWNKLYLKEALEKVEAFPNIFVKGLVMGEDMDFNIKCFSKMNKVVFSKERFYYYRIRRHSATTGSFNEKKLRVYEGLDVAEKISNEKNYAEAFNCINARRGLIAYALLNKISKSDYKNLEEIQRLLLYLKNSIRPLHKSKRTPFYQRIFVWLIYLYFKFKMRKRIKNCK